VFGVIPNNGGLAMNRPLLVEKIVALKHTKEIPWKELAETSGSDVGGPAESAAGQIGISYARKAGSPCGANQ
jgi:hypothetical protein